MKLVILDRDGVINEDSEDYIKSPDEWRAIPGSLKAIRELSEAGFSVVVVTNQSGLGRGLFDEKTLTQIHQKMCDAVENNGGKITDIFYCPHHPNDNCNCRKPKTGLLEAVQKKFTISLKNVAFIGDTFKDVDVAKKMECLPILVKTGKGLATLKQHPELINAIPVFENLAAAVAFLLSTSSLDKMP